MLMFLPAKGEIFSTDSFVGNTDSVPELSSNVVVNGRVCTFGSVLSYCEGDTLAAVSLSRPVPGRGNYLPSWRVRLEEVFNDFGLRWASPVICFILLSLFIASGRVRWSWCVIAGVLLFAEFILRSLLAERIGLSGRSDSLLAVAMAISFILPFFKNRNVAMTGVVLMTILSVAGAVMAEHPAVKPINPALVSGWLPIHVGLMMASYSIFIFAGCAAVGGMDLRRLKKLLVVGEIILLAGVSAGSAWAADAWGNWWSWDPKETFAMVTAIIYGLLIIFWNRIVSKDRIVRTLTVAALASVALTWFGISRLGGRHTYDSDRQKITLTQHIMKKRLEIPYLSDLNPENLEEAVEILDEKGVRQTIDCVNWPEDFPYKPLASFTAAHSKDHLFIDFTVKGNGLRAVNTENNSDVYQDSCVEFFVARDDDDHYRNIEFNCIGTVHSAYRKDRHNGEMADDVMLSSIKRRSSCGNEPFDEKPGIHMWNLTVAIPLSVIGVDYEPGKPIKLRGNFYKCGDATSKPHFISWSPIGTPTPDFHCPEYFGELILL